MKLLGKILKKTLKIIFWTLLILILLLIGLYFASGKLIQHFAPDFISKVTQTETTLGNVDISLFSGHLGLNNLSIGNPAGFKDKNAFQLGKIAVNFDPKSILTKKIIINNVAIDGVKVSTELNAKDKTNVSVLLDNIDQFIGPQTDSQSQKTVRTPAPKASETTDQSPAVVIRDLTINNSSVRAGIMGQMMEIPLPDIHQKNIGEQQKKSWAAIVMGLLDTINSESTKAVTKATKEAVEKGIQAGKDAVSNLTDTIKNLF